MTGEVEAPAFLRAEWNEALVHQVFKSIVANLRKPVAHTKDRSEVSGGGKKPWRQKGTGRARQGSIRSPLWKGGGVTFGPRKTTDYSQKINKKMMRGALESVLSKKNSLGELKIFGSSIPGQKTKDAAKKILNLSGGKSVILVVSNDDKDILRITNNLKNVKGVRSKNLNLYDVVSNKIVLMDQKAISEINK